MHQIEAEFTFAAAHRLPRYNGKCFNLHGHNYRFQVAVRGEADPYSGMLNEYSILNFAESPFALMAFGNMICIRVSLII